MPPRVWLHVSKLPRLRAAGGLPALVQAWQRVRQAATSRARLARTQIIRSGWRKPSRRQGWSLRASRRMRTRRRAISCETAGLLPVATQVQRTGSRMMSETPRIPQPQPRSATREHGHMARIDASSRYRPWHTYRLKTTMWVIERLPGWIPPFGSLESEPRTRGNPVYEFTA
jgi:hypothetical protein